MSRVTRKVHRLERFRAKVHRPVVAEAPGRGKTTAVQAKTEKFKAVLGLRKEIGKQVRELDALGVDVLKDKLAESRKELFNLRFKKATGQLERVSDLSATKRRIARILTLIKQKEVGA